MNTYPKCTVTTGSGDSSPGGCTGSDVFHMCGQFLDEVEDKSGSVPGTTAPQTTTQASTSQALHTGEREKEEERERESLPTHTHTHSLSDGESQTHCSSSQRWI